METPESSPSFPGEENISPDKTKAKKLRKEARAELVKPKFNPELVKELVQNYRSTKIPEEEVAKREDGYHRYHKTCGTDLMFPAKKNFPDRNVYKAISSFRDNWHGVLFCSSCDRIYIFGIEH